MTDLVLVRNRKTGLEKMVPPATAEHMKNEACFMEEWEVPKEGSPTPHEVIKFQEKKSEETTAADKRHELKKAEAAVEKLKAEVEAKEAEAEVESKKAKEKLEAEKEDLSVLSVKKMADKLEYLTIEQLEGLRSDERVSIVRMVEKELKNREDESNT